MKKTLLLAGLVSVFGLNDAMALPTGAHGGNCEYAVSNCCAEGRARCLAYSGGAIGGACAAGKCRAEGGGIFVGCDQPCSINGGALFSVYAEGSSGNKTDKVQTKVSKKANIQLVK